MESKEHSGSSGKLNLILSKYGILLGLFVIIIIAGIVNPAFLTVSNILNIFKQVSATGMLALGMTFVIISGGVDLAVGSIMSVAGVITVSLMPALGVPLAIGAGLLSAIILGGLNGLFITLTGGTMGSSFIISFGMQTAIASLALTITDGAIRHADKFPEYKVIGQGSIGVIPIAALIFIVGIVITQFVLRKTRFGRITYCLGINDTATKLSGIKVKPYRVMIYVISGFFAAVGAVMLCSRVVSASPTQGSGYELDAIAATVLGGTRMGGGYGSAIKTLLGVIMFGVMANALNVLGVSAYPQLIVKGAIIIIAVLLDKRSARVENEMLARES